MQSPSVFYTA